MNYNSIDIFAGVGGLTLGLKKAGFKTVIAIEMDKKASDAYQLNNPSTLVINDDIRNVKKDQLLEILKKETLHLLAGCPPCQGFSSIRRLNKRANVRDKRNSLILEYLRLVKLLNPYTLMMENVPGIKDYYLFDELIRELLKMDYYIDYKIVNVKDYGVPQSRRRLVLLGSRLGKLEVQNGSCKQSTVRDAIGGMESVLKSEDPIHRIFPHHSEQIQKLIELIPRDGGSRKSLPDEYILNCHKKPNVGFNDVYGRLRWDDFSTTITGGCLNPSKGRFLHPEENRCISAREAALLQTFPLDYQFPANISKAALALLIGNALPPKFSYHQSLTIKNHLSKYID